MMRLVWLASVLVVAVPVTANVDVAAVESMREIVHIQ
jgi:hypothetical protein